MGVLCGRVCVPERNPDDVRLACKQDSVCVCLHVCCLFVIVSLGLAVCVLCFFRECMRGRRA